MGILLAGITVAGALFGLSMLVHSIYRLFRR